MDELQIARDAYSSSTTYLDANYRKKWEDAIHMFHSEHPQDSKYKTEAYKHRSKLFRPKTRGMVRKNEAAAAQAFFSNVDVVSTDAVDESNKEQIVSAAVMKELLNYRLQKTIPWFQIITGGVQDAMTVGVVCSFQHWKYQTKKIKRKVPVLDEFGSPIADENGQPLTTDEVETKVIKDEPCVEILPVENLRIDPAADWMDPVNSSPYVIRLMPMYVGDIKRRMKEVDEKTGEPKWKTLDDGQIRSSMEENYDSTRQVREGKREDSKDNRTPVGDFEIAWVRQYFVREDGEEFVFYTLGSEHLLSEARPLEEVYFHGERPISMGCAVIETHKIYSDSPTMLGENLQREANEVVNQRLDNVKLVLNKRYFAKRGAQIDLKSLVRNVPASITLMNDPRGDVVPIDYQDVTSSSYQEQDRINADYDDVLGNFSSGSVQTNRKLNETVGGMSMLSNTASQMTEYTLRTITETWIERVLRQLVKLEQFYETDQVILAIAADRAKIFQKYGVNEVTDDLLKQELTLTVNVGMGATDPIMKLNRFVGAVKTYAELAALQPPGLDIRETGKEVFGLAGYRDGRRFLEEEEDPKMQAVIQQAQAMIQQAQKDVMEAAQETDAEREKVEAEKIKLAEDRMALKDSALTEEQQLDRKQKRIDDDLRKAQSMQDAIDLAMKELNLVRRALDLDEKDTLDGIDARRQLLGDKLVELQNMFDKIEESEEMRDKEVAVINQLASTVDSMQSNQNELVGTIGELIKTIKAPKTKVVTSPSGKKYKSVETLDGIEVANG